jgi:hypothetical protein
MPGIFIPGFFVYIRQSVTCIPFIEVTAVEKQLEIVYIPEEEKREDKEITNVKLNVLKFIVSKAREKNMKNK